MVSDFEPEYRSGPSSDEDAISVLYVDDDADTLAAITEYVERSCDSMSFWGTTDPVEALKALESRTWGCLIVGGGLSVTELERLVERAESAIVLFASAGSRDEPDAVLAAVDSVVEKGTTDAIVAFLVETVGALARDEAGSEDVLARALAEIDSDPKTNRTAFLIDADGALVWSNDAFEDVFPLPADASTNGDFDDRLAAVFGAAPDEAADFLTVDAPRNSDASESGSAGDRYYHYESYDLPAETGASRLALFDDVTERVARETRMHWLELLAEQVRDGLFVQDEDCVLVFCNDAFASMLGYERDELIGKHAAEFYDEAGLRAFQETVQDVATSPESGGIVDLSLVDRFGEPVPSSIAFTVSSTADGAFDALVCVARAVADRSSREDEATTRRDEPVTISRADAMVRDVVRELGAVSSRQELGQAVCERLTDLDDVSMAWIGNREGGNDRIVPCTIVGEPKQYLEDVVATTSVEDAKGGPVLTAVETGEVVVVNDFRENELVEYWRDLALSYDIYGMVMVPITHGETTHGVLCSYAQRPDAFSDPLVERLSLLGETVGFAMTAVQNKHLLERDVVLELEFRSESEDACLVWLAAACDCRLDVVGSVDLGDGVLQYLAVDGTSVERVVDEVLERDAISGARVVRSDGSIGGVVELRTTTSLQTTLSDAGARLREAISTPSGTRIVVEAPRASDVRTIREAVSRSNPDAELVTKTERERAAEAETGGIPVDDALTDRQREVLQAAYLTGYYAWPRDTTAEKLAESLDIASPTLHQHLRRAEYNIFTALFDD